MIKESIARLVEKQDLTESEARGAMAEIMAGEATPAQIAAFFTSLRMKGEKAAEIIGCARAMRTGALKVNTNRRPLLDTCGTGGDASGTFNISTVAAFVIAGTGVAVAKHGNRSVSSRCGSADLLEALGVKIDLGPDEVGHCLDEAGIGFLFAQKLHPAMKHAAGPRREVGIRTVFNILGPLANPAGAEYQVLGVYSSQLTEIMAAVLSALGTRRAMIVHGHGGLDEISITGRTKATLLIDGDIYLDCIDPRDLGLNLAAAEDLRGGAPPDNARIAVDVLRGKRSPKRDVVLLNAAAGLVVSEKSADLKMALSLAAESIDSGSALRKLEELIALSHRLCEVHA
jgi:anthranilate phosphoribosyltransferase